jgi:prepilin-type N-terminal cleavage/methylation domain-containing protein
VKMFRTKTEGFTLVELMVVVLIIGILVAIAVPVFLNASANAAAKSCQANQRTIVGAIQTAVASNATTPTVAGTLETAGTGWGVLAPSYLKTIPRCPNHTASSATPGFYLIGVDGTVGSDQVASGATSGTTFDALHQLH